MRSISPTSIDRTKTAEDKEVVVGAVEGLVAAEAALDSLDEVAPGDAAVVTVAATGLLSLMVNLSLEMDNCKSCVLPLAETNTT